MDKKKLGITNRYMFTDGDENEVNSLENEILRIK